MGPLKGIKVIEMAGIGPGPFAGMLLADMGAEVISVERRIDKSGNRLPDCSRRGNCLLYTSPSPRDATLSRMPSSA